MPRKGSSYSGVIHLFGEVNSPVFIPWAKKYGKKIGVIINDHHFSENQLTLKVGGKQEMLICFSLGCSLGPASVLINHVENEFYR